ncbi:prolyl oligopeptidase family serine peptidase [Pseudomonas sp. NFXW11]|uniref:alpha/beta hydrolase n=1 Tax=Pseudomonas sp. NFXW11 TaxID=2819531 RepID=UPI003CF6A4BD
MPVKSLRTLLISTLLLLATSLAAAEPQAVAARQLARGDGSSITWYLWQRHIGPAPKALLVIIQGSDCNSVTRIPGVYRHLARALPEADVLTVEKYAIEASLPYDHDPERADCPAAYLRHDSPSQRAQDLQAVLAHLQQDRRYSRIVALGGSEGAVVAHLLAARSNLVHATVAFNGGGQWFRDDLLHGLASSPQNPAQQAESRRELLGFIQQVQQQPAADLQASGHGAGWWQDVLRLDQLALLQGSRVPALIIQSGADEAVSVSAVTRMIAQLREHGRPGLAFRPYPGLDHRLADTTGTSRMAEVVSDIALWLRQLPLASREPG